jgi:GntR family transcriptional regulator
VTIEFDNNMPIYIQIMTHVKKMVITGKLGPGDKIDSVRELAAELQINPNTIQRTFQELEREGIVETRRGMGRYVTSEESTIMRLKKEMAGDMLERFVLGMKELGFDDSDILALVKDTVHHHSERERES